MVRKSDKGTNNGKGPENFRYQWGKWTLRRPAREIHQERKNQDVQGYLFFLTDVVGYVKHLFLLNCKRYLLSHVSGNYSRYSNGMAEFRSWKNVIKSLSLLSLSPLFSSMLASFLTLSFSYGSTAQGFIIPSACYLGRKFSFLGIPSAPIYLSISGKRLSI